MQVAKGCLIENGEIAVMIMREGDERERRVSGNLSVIEKSP